MTSARGDTTIVIMGATGDLAQRKLLPALFNLACKGRLPEGLRIVGFARTVLSEDAFREFTAPVGTAHFQGRYAVVTSIPGGEVGVLDRRSIDCRRLAFGARLIDRR